MSLYQVDRVFFDVIGSDSELQTFLAEPLDYLAGLDLTDEERTALAECDAGALWTMGAHPLLLMRFVTKVQVAGGHPPAEVMRDYKAAIEPFGRPEYET